MKSEKIIVISCLSILYLGFILFLVVPKKAFSENENRYLQTMPIFSFPALFEKKFIPELEEYINDNFILRDKWVALKSGSELLVGKREINDIFIGKNEYLIEKYKKLSSRDYERMVNILNKFSEKVDNISFLLIPSKISIYKDYLPEHVNSKEELEAMYKLYEDLLGYKMIDIYSILKEHREEELFFRLDHHWNMLGAYYAYQEICKIYNLECMSLDEFAREIVTNDFKGTFYSRTGIYHYKPDVIEVYNSKKDTKYKVKYVFDNKETNTLYEKDYLKRKDKYSYFLDNNHPLIIIENEKVLERELLIVKDSYANILIPFLLNHFSRIHVIDPRYYPDAISDYALENNIKETLIIYNMNGIGKDQGVFQIR